MQPQSLENRLTAILFRAVDEDIEAFPTLPNLLNQYLFFKVVKESLNALRHVDVDPEPVDRNQSLDDADSKYVAVLPVGALE